LLIKRLLEHEVVLLVLYKTSAIKATRRVMEAPTTEALDDPPPVVDPVVPAAVVPEEASPQTPPPEAPA